MEKKPGHSTFRVGMKFIGGFVNIQNNDLLEDVVGLDNVTTIGGQLLMFNNMALRDLKGLHSLRSIGNGGIGLLFNQNVQVANFDGLQNLRSVTGEAGHFKIAEQLQVAADRIQGFKSDQIGQGVVAAQV